MFEEFALADSLLTHRPSELVDFAALDFTCIKKDMPRPYPVCEWLNDLN